MSLEMSTIYSKKDERINIHAIDGHFATVHSHITSYLDITTLKTRCSDARQVADLMAKSYSTSTPVDTILCLDGMDVIGCYLSEKLTEVGILSYNAHKTLYVIHPEYTTGGQIIFRDNYKITLKGKNVLILLGSVTTGGTLRTVMNTLAYYGATCTGVSAIFSAIEEIDGMPVNSIFGKEDVPEYSSFTQNKCPLCKAKVPIQALVNSYGYAEL